MKAVFSRPTFVTYQHQIVREIANVADASHFCHVG